MFYTGQVLEKYALSQEFFDNQSGRLQNKTFGLKLLEGLGNEKAQVSEFKDIGDSILMNLGFFPNRLEKAAVQKDYYLDLGKRAYFQVESMNHKFYDIPGFYKLFSSSLENVVKVVEVMSNSFEYESLERYLLETESPGEANLFGNASSVKASWGYLPTSTLFHSVDKNFFRNWLNLPTLSLFILLNVVCW